ncbi:MAG: tripartite tricarboxylate transporter substrate binding protein [Acetobacteraceae bacterium]|nr:tripartite tricarboxylate transporter substrate binding protein [Acetobacteraceae bacterium]
MPTRRSLAVLAALAPFAAARAQAPSWPDRTVRAMVPFGPGGAIDILIRVLAPHFPAQANGQSLVVENRPGAGGTIGAAQVAAARPDGTTLLMAELASAALAHELYRDLPYDPRRSFTPVIFLADLPMLLVANANLPLRDMAGVIARARSPNGLSYASVGTGHISHLTMERLRMAAGDGARMLHVVYRSGAENMAAVARGDVDVAVTSLSSAAGFLQQGAIRAIAVTTAAPIEALPGVPPMAATVPGLTATLWYGLVGPAGMGPEVTARANAAFNAILALPEVRDTLRRQQGADIIGGPPERFAAHIRDEIARWTPVIRGAGIRVE